MRTIDYQKLDAAHHLHPFTDSMALGENVRVIERAEGIYLWDSEGNQILDGMSGLWCVNIGYGRHEIVEAAMEQMKKIPYYNTFFQCATPSTIKLAAALSKIAPDGFNRVFFTNSGSEANDTVVRMIRRYWELCGQSERKIIISRRNAYHGSTMAGASLGGMAFMHAQGGLPIPDIVHICQPYYYGEGEGKSVDAFGIECAQALEHKIKELGSHRIAAFIAEPVQGAGGVIIPPDNYWPEIQRICDKYDVPIVADEVICGFGRLGHWFGSQHFGIKPKLISIAKGMTSGYLPMGGVLIHDAIADVLMEKCGEFAHGFTYSGHPTCAAAALENLRIFSEEHIIKTVSEKSAPYFQKNWKTLSKHPWVQEARGLGMVAALELRVPDGAVALSKGALGILCRDLSIKNGLVMRAVGDTMIVAPPLVITNEQIDEMINKVWTTLELLSQSQKS